MSESRPSRKDIAIVTGVAAILAGTTLAVGQAIENRRPRPQATEIYKGGSAIVELQRAVGRTTLFTPGKDDVPNDVDESTLTVNGQSLAGVERIRVRNPKIVETPVIDYPPKSPRRIKLSIIVPFDNGVELYYQYGDGNIELRGNGDFIKGQEAPDGGFTTSDGSTIPPQEVSVVEAIPNKPPAP